MSHRFYQPGNWSSGQAVFLETEQAHHAVRVLRIESGSKIELFNGKGLIGQATVLVTSKKAVELQIDSVQSIENPWKLTLAFSLGKPASTEFILRRATEIGIRSFQPIRSAHSQPGDFKGDRWNKILLEVCKQCQETHLPELLPEMPLEKWLSAWQPRPVLFCDEAEREGAIAFPADASEIAVAIGPEGGWNGHEREIFRRSKALIMGLGRNRLRAETAAVVAVTLAKVRLGEIR